MSVFDTLAERRYQTWLKARQDPRYVAPEPVSTSAAPKSLEGLLWQEIVSSLSQAAALPAGSRRDALLQRAGSLEFQLIVGLEKKGLPLVARTLREAIRKRQSKLVQATTASTNRGTSGACGHPHADATHRGMDRLPSDPMQSSMPATR